MRLKKTRRSFFFKRLTALVLCLGVAGPDARVLADVLPSGTDAAAVSLSLPLSHPFPSQFGTVEEFHQGPSGKIILFIKDAHDVLEAQENIAGLLDHLVEKENVQTVFEEGFEGPVPTGALFEKIHDPETRRRTSYYLLDQLQIGGAEYAHINRKRSFRLVGADSFRDHFENVRLYGEAARSQEEIEKDFQAAETELENLLGRLRLKPLSEFLRLQKDRDQNKIDLIVYLRELCRAYLAAAGDNAAFEARYPALSQTLQAIGTRKAEALQSMEKFETAEIFEEIERLESDLADSLAQAPRARKLLNYYEALRLLRRLARLEVNPEEYRTARETLKDFKTQELAEFLAAEGRKTVVLPRRWEKKLESAIGFYETALRRDENVSEAMRRFSKGDEKMAALVYGGFHASRIRAILKDSGMSYAVVSPAISNMDARHRDYYRKDMAGTGAVFKAGLAREMARPITIIEKTFAGSGEQRAWAAEQMTRLGRVMEKLRGDLPQAASEARLLLERESFAHAELRATTALWAGLAEIAEGREPEPSERQQLAAMLDNDPAQTVMAPYFGSDKEKIVSDRIEVLRKVWPAYREFWRTQVLREDVAIDSLWRVYLPLAQWTLAEKRTRRPDGLFVLGIGGAIGSGKTTLARVIALLLNEMLTPEEGQSVASSLDDYYLAKAIREKLREKGYAPGMKVNRALPGTQDVDWILRKIHEMESSGPDSAIELPRFSKLKDDHEPPVTVRGKVGVFVFEGWLTGANTDIDAAQVEPGLKRVVAEEMAKYKPVFDRFDALFAFPRPSVERMIAGRIQQDEHQAKTSGKREFTDEQIERAIRYWEVDYWQPPVTSPAPKNDATNLWIEADASRNITAVRAGGRWGRAELRAAPKTLDQFLNTMGTSSTERPDPSFLRFALKPEGQKFFFDMYKTAIGSAIGERLAAEFDESMIEKDAYLVRDENTGVPYGILFKFKTITGYFDFSELSAPIDTALDFTFAKRQSSRQAEKVSRMVYKKQVVQYHTLEKLTLTQLTGRESRWVGEERRLSGRMGKELLSLFVIMEVQGPKETDIFLRPDQKGSLDFQQLLFRLRETRPELFDGVVGIGGTGTGIDSLLSMLYGAKAVKGSELYDLLKILGSLNISYAKETRQVPENIPVEIEVKDGIPESPEIKTLIFNLPVITKPGDRATFQPMNVTLPMKLLPSTGSVLMTETDLRPILAQIAKLLAGAPERHAVVRLDMTMVWGGNKAADYLSKLEAYLKPFGLALAGHHGGPFVELQAAPYAAAGKWHHIKSSIAKVEEEVKREKAYDAAESLLWFLNEVEKDAAGSVPPEELRSYKQRIEALLQPRAEQQDTHRPERAELRMFIEDLVRLQFSSARVPFRDEHIPTGVGVFRPTLSSHIEPLTQYAQYGPQRVIDMGSGQGAMVIAFAMANEQAEVLGIEFDERLFNESVQVRESLPAGTQKRVRLERGNFNAPEFAEEIQKADLINYWETGSAAELKMLDTLSEHMRPGARFLVTKNFGSLIRDIQAAGYFDLVETDPDHGIYLFKRSGKPFLSTVEVTLDREFLPLKKIAAVEGVYPRITKGFSAKSFSQSLDFIEHGLLPAIESRAAALRGRENVRGLVIGTGTGLDGSVILGRLLNDIRPQAFHLDLIDVNAKAVENTALNLEALLKQSNLNYRISRTQGKIEIAVEGRGVLRIFHVEERREFANLENQAGYDFISFNAPNLTEDVPEWWRDQGVMMEGSSFVELVNRARTRLAADGIFVVAARKTSRRVFELAQYTVKVLGRESARLPLDTSSVGSFLFSAADRLFENPRQVFLLTLALPRAELRSVSGGPQPVFKNTLRHYEAYPQQSTEASGLDEMLAQAAEMIRGWDPRAKQPLALVETVEHGGQKINLTAVHTPRLVKAIAVRARPDAAPVEIFSIEILGNLPVVLDAFRAYLAAAYPAKTFSLEMGVGGFPSGYQDTLMITVHDAALVPPPQTQLALRSGAVSGAQHYNQITGQGAADSRALAATKFRSLDPRHPKQRGELRTDTGIFYTPRKLPGAALIDFRDLLTFTPDEIREAAVTISQRSEVRFVIHDAAAGHERFLYFREVFKGFSNVTFTASSGAEVFRSMGAALRGRGIVALVRPDRDLGVYGAAALREVRFFAMMEDRPGTIAVALSYDPNQIIFQNGVSRRGRLYVVNPFLAGLAREYNNEFAFASAA